MSHDPPPAPSPGAAPDALEDSALVYLLGLAFQQLLQATQDRVEPAGYPDLRPIHAFALRVLAREEVTSAELAVRLGMTKQGAGKLLDYLQAHGYVARQAHPLGGRRRLVVLTPSGRRHLADADALMRAVEAEWTAPLDDTQLRDLRANLVAAVRGFSAGSAPPPLRPIW